jgi:hypothetical protein
MQLQLHGLNVTVALDFGPRLQLFGRDNLSE